MLKSSVKNDKKILKIALIGNPNCGKTTLFNQLTGSNQYVGNWPGVTVEKKEGTAKFRDKILNIIDLPGIYSLSPYSSEEIITRNYLISKDTPDVVINIIDSTNIERNLYLTTQLLEMKISVIVALNMMDLFYREGNVINFEELSSRLGVPIVPISASKREGLENLIKVCITNFSKESKINDFYEDRVLKIINNIEKIIKNDHIHSRWYAVKLLEDDPLVLKSFKLGKEKFHSIDSLKKNIKISKNIDRQIILADQRYKYIYEVCKKSIIKNSAAKEETLTDKIDKILTHKLFALPIFFLFMFITFSVTFGDFGNFFKNQVENFIDGPLTLFILDILKNLGTSVWAKSLILDGILKGVGAAASFLPQIVILFTFLSFLEGTGYMSRCAFIMDRLLKKLGLSGHCFVPMLMGFGCTVPAIMGTRIIEKERDKFLTIFMLPFMSCSAKITIYSMMASAFFKEEAPIVIFLLYLLGIAVGMISVFIVKIVRKDNHLASFIMELPSYKMPTFKSLFLKVFDSIKDFVKRAGTVLISCSSVIWFLETFDFNFKMVQNGEGSILSLIAEFIAPIFVPCGFGNWRTSVSLIAGLAAKESVVSTMAVLYSSTDSSGFVTTLSSIFTKASALSFLVFVLLYTPCFAAVSAMRREFNSTKKTFLVVCYQLFVAWFFSSLTFLIASFVF